MATTPDAGRVVSPGYDGDHTRPQTTLARSRRAPLAVAAIVAALWAAVLTYLPLVAFAMLARAGAGSGAVLSFAAASWLLAQGVPVPVDGETISLVPLLVTGLAIWRLVRAGVHTSRALGVARSRSLSAALTAGGAVGLAYAVIGGIAAAWVNTSVSRAAFTIGLLAAVSAGLGALKHSRASRSVTRRAPAVVRDAVRTGAGAAALLVGVGAAAAGATLAVHSGDATSMLAGYHAGVAGQAGITLLCLAFAPNLAIWGAAYLLGPGFALGLGTVVSPGLVAVGPVPSVPILAGLPLGAVSGFGTALLGLPLLAAMIAGALLARRRGQVGWPRLLGSAVLAGPAAGGLLALAAVAASGALGTGRLSEIGPSGWSTGLWAALVVSGGALVGAAAYRTMRRTPAPPSPTRTDG